MKAKMVNANQETIETIYFKKDWQKILKIRNNVRIPTANPITVDNYVHDQPDSVWEIIDRDGIIVHDNDSFLNKIMENPSSVLENPTDIYFVERTIKKKFLNNNTGVFVTAQKSVSALPLKASWEMVLRKGEYFSWNEFFRSDVINKVIPSNSLILVDRYMFSLFGEGFKNLKDILDAVLPATLNGDYHVLIITDGDSIIQDESHPDIDTAIKDLQDVVPSLGRTYDIVLEVLTVRTLGNLLKGDAKNQQELTQLINAYKKTTPGKALKEFYADTHDRHIISNYFSVSADHALSAVKKLNDGDSIASFSQTLKFESLYAGIDNKFQDQKSLPVKISDNVIKSVRKFTNSTSPNCLYYINAKKGDVSKIQNRLLL